MKLGKIIGCAALGALVLAAIPYRFKKDEETGAREIRSLLWAWRKTPARAGETKDHYAFAIPPSGLDAADGSSPDAPAEETVDLTPADEPAEEASGEAPADAAPAE